MADKIKVMIVEDSSLVRKIISDILTSDPDIEVVGTANNGKTAVYRNDQLNPDVITMDIEMPIMDGLEALREIIRKNPKPVIMMSVFTQHGTEATFKALEYGAVDFIPKPASNISLSLNEISALLIEKVKAAYKSNVKVPQISEIGYSANKSDKHAAERPKATVLPPVALASKDKSDKIIAIGTSTGGPSALIEIFKRLPKELPCPVFVVQHMPAGFTLAFSERLDALSPIKVKEAADNDIVKPGYAYIAHGDFHMKIENSNGSQAIRVFQSDKVSGHRPSIDVLFDSVARVYGKRAIGVIMTGMGQDGANGIKEIKDRGGYTIAQDAETSVVYGMNRVAVSFGAINEVLPLGKIPERIVDLL